MALLRAAGEPLHLMAADALANSGTTTERLQERVCQLEAIARLNGQTIRKMQRAARAAERAQYRGSTRNGDFDGRR